MLSIVLVEYIINMRLVSWHGSVSLVSCQADTVTDFTNSSSRIKTLCCHNLSEPAVTRKIKTAQLLSRTVCTSTVLTTICACSLMRCWINPAVNDLTFTKFQKNSFTWSSCQVYGLLLPNQSKPSNVHKKLNPMTVAFEE